MPLNVCTRLGHCDATALIGRAMDQVYQAADTTLSCPMALTGLPTLAAAVDLVEHDYPQLILEFFMPPPPSP